MDFRCSFVQNGGPSCVRCQRRAFVHANLIQYRLAEHESSFTISDSTKISLLPFDILVEIAEQYDLFPHSYTWRRELLRLTLVSRSFFHAFQPLLFRTFSFSLLLDRVHNICCILTQPRIVSHIRHLIITGYDGADEDMDPIRRLVGHTPNLRHLALFDANIDHPLFFQIISAPALRHLQLTRCTISMSAERIALAPPSSIRRLTLSDNEKSTRLEGLFTHLRTSLSSIIIDNHQLSSFFPNLEPSDLSDIQAISLRLKRHTYLLHLERHLPGPAFQRDTYHATFVDLQKFLSTSLVFLRELLLDEKLAQWPLVLPTGSLPLVVVLGYIHPETVRNAVAPRRLAQLRVAAWNSEDVDKLQKQITTNPLPSNAILRLSLPSKFAWKPINEILKHTQLGELHLDVNDPVTYVRDSLRYMSLTLTGSILIGAILEAYLPGH